MAYSYRRPRRTRSSSRRRGVNKRTNLWVRSWTVSAVGVVANYAVECIPNTSLDPGARIGATVVRTLGTVELLGAQPTSASGGLFVGLAVGDVINWTATAPPFLPVTDANLVDWMHWRYLPLASLAVGKYANPPGAPTTASFVYDFDAKVSRRMNQPNEGLVLVVQNNGIAGTTGLSVAVQTLLKLS